jgi:biotin operon repressor
MNIRQEQIVCILHKADDWVTAKEFQRKIQISPRELRNEVADLRKQGLVIDSGNYGYKIAKSQQEAERCIARLRATANSILDVTDAMNISKNALPRNEVEQG